MVKLKNIKKDIFHSYKILLGYLLTVILFIGIDALIIDNVSTIENEIIRNLLIGVAIVSTGIIVVGGIFTFIVYLYNLFVKDKNDGIEHFYNTFTRLFIIIIYYIKVFIIGLFVYTALSPELTFQDIFTFAKDFIINLGYADIIAFLFILVLIATVLLNIYYILSTFVLKIKPTKYMLVIEGLGLFALFLAASVFFTPYQLAAYLLLLLSFGLTIYYRKIVNHKNFKNLLVPIVIIIIMIPLAFIYENATTSVDDELLTQDFQVTTDTYLEQDINTAVGPATLIEDGEWPRLYIKEYDGYYEYYDSYMSFNTDNIYISKYDDNVTININIIDKENGTKTTCYGSYNVNTTTASDVIMDFSENNCLDEESNEILTLFLNKENIEELNNILISK